MSKLTMGLLCLCLSSVAQAAFINEIHYDNSGGDTGEGVELAGTAGEDLTDWSLQFYNGSNGTVYDSLDLSGVLPDLQAGFGVLSFSVSGLQNGAPDGIALLDNLGAVVQFLSYEGSLTASGGPASGLTSTDIGVAEDGDTAVGFSLQLTGSGSDLADFVWSEAAAASMGLINTGQTFVGEELPVVNPVPEPATLSLLGLGVLLLLLASRSRWRQDRSVPAPA